PASAFASSNLGVSGTPTSVTPVLPNIFPFTTIRMLDKTHGWALNGASVLKTSDGGLHWQVVSPSSSLVSPGSQGTSKSQITVWAAWTFIDQNVAWVVGMTEPKRMITIQHTTDGGHHWQSSQISDNLAPIAVVLDPPHFLNMQEGWQDVERVDPKNTGTV